MAREETVSLVFGLKPSAAPDLEIVSLVTLEWVRSIQAAATAIDPSASVRVLYVSTERGSLRKRALIVWDKGKRNPILATIVAASAVFGIGIIDEIRDRVTVELVDYLQGEFLPEIDYCWGDDDDDEKEEDQEDEGDSEIHYYAPDVERPFGLEQMLNVCVTSNEVQNHKRNLFYNLQRDPTIISIGISVGEDGTEILNIPSNRFAEYEGFWSSDDGHTKDVEHILDVTLSQEPPTSVTELWRFHQYGMGHLNAIMEDVEFLAEFRKGELKGRIGIGTEMRIRVKVRMKMTSKGWRGIRGGKSVTQVLHPRTGLLETAENLYAVPGPISNTEDVEDC